MGFSRFRVIFDTSTNANDFIKDEKLKGKSCLSFRYCKQNTNLLHAGENPRMQQLNRRNPENLEEFLPSTAVKFTIEGSDLPDIDGGM